VRAPRSGPTKAIINKRLRVGSCLLFAITYGEFPLGT
jgi:hypothetical protein